MLAMSAIHSPDALHYQALPAVALSQELIATWQDIVNADRQFRSPFFSPGYTRLVAGCVSDVMVGLMMLEGEVVGIFPYEKIGPRKARPVGSVFCDYQAAVVKQDVPWTVEGLLNGLELDSWHFDHVLTSQKQWAAFHKIHDVSWSIDISEGFDAYEARLRASKHKQLVEAYRKKRKIEREIGPLSFTPHVVDHNLLDQLLSWKSEQWSKSGWYGRYTASWEQCLMHRLVETNEQDFAGIFSVLHVGDRPIAMHIGMRSRHVWHYWTTAYDPKFSHHSPGILMLVEMLRAAPDMGIDELDMGKEDFEYKRRFHTHVINLAEGSAYRDGDKNILEVGYA